MGTKQPALKWYSIDDSKSPRVYGEKLPQIDDLPPWTENSVEFMRQAKEFKNDVGAWKGSVWGPEGEFKLGVGNAIHFNEIVDPILMREAFGRAPVTRRQSVGAAGGPAAVTVLSAQTIQNIKVVLLRQVDFVDIDGIIEAIQTCDVLDRYREVGTLNPAGDQEAKGFLESVAKVFLLKIDKETGKSPEKENLLASVAAKSGSVDHLSREERILYRFAEDPLFPERMRLIGEIREMNNSVQTTLASMTQWKHVAQRTLTSKTLRQLMQATVRVMNGLRQGRGGANPNAVSRPLCGLRMTYDPMADGKWEGSELVKAIMYSTEKGSVGRFVVDSIYTDTLSGQKLVEDMSAEFTAAKQERPWDDTDNKAFNRSSPDWFKERLQELESMDADFQSAKIMVTDDYKAVAEALTLEAQEAVFLAKPGKTPELWETKGKPLALAETERLKNRAVFAFRMDTLMRGKPLASGTLYGNLASAVDKDLFDDAVSAEAATDFPGFNTEASLASAKKRFDDILELMDVVMAWAGEPVTQIKETKAQQASMILYSAIGFMRKVEDVIGAKAGKDKETETVFQILRKQTAASVVFTPNLTGLTRVRRYEIYAKRAATRLQAPVLAQLDTVIGLEPQIRLRPGEAPTLLHALHALCLSRVK